jgi:hypothetical protein
MKNTKLLTIILVVSFTALACMPAEHGQKGEFGGGWFKTNCEGQLPSLCEKSPLPDIAVGTDPQLYYESDSGYPEAVVEPVSGTLLQQASWSNVYSGTTIFIYDYTFMESQDIRSMRIVRADSIGETVLTEPVEVGCGASSGDNYLAPMGSSGYLIGVGTWSGRVVPDIADVVFDGNRIVMTSNNTSPDDVSALLTVTLESSEQRPTFDFDLTVCHLRPEPVEEIVEVIDTAEIEDAGEPPDAVEEEADGEADMPAEAEDPADDDALAEEDTDV